MGRRTREHTVKIHQIKDGEIIKDEFICTHQDHAMEFIKDYVDYYIEVYDIAGNLIHSKNKHILEIKEEPVVETNNEEPVVETQIIETQELVIETKIVTEEPVKQIVESKIVKKAPAKKPAAKKVIKKLIK